MLKTFDITTLNGPYKLKTFIYFDLRFLFENSNNLTIKLITRDVLFSHRLFRNRSGIEST